MADWYVDQTGAGDDTTWSGWATAGVSMELAVEGAGPLDRVFAKTSADATLNPESSGTTTIASPGTKFAPVYVYGCKAGTTNEPPTAADLTVRGDADAPIKSTTANTDLLFTGYACFYGYQLLAARAFGSQISAAVGLVYDRCKIGRSQFEGGSDSNHWLGNNLGTSNTWDVFLRFLDCEINQGVAQGKLMSGNEALLEFFGGEFTGVQPDSFVTTNANRMGGKIHVRGHDMSYLGTAPIVTGTNQVGTILFENCRIPDTVALATQQLDATRAGVIFHNCTDTTGITTSALGLRTQRMMGAIELETTAVRTGGSSDPAGTAFSYAMTPAADDADYRFRWLESPVLSIYVRDPGSVSEVSVYIANSSGAPFQNDEVWIETYSSNAAIGTAQYLLASNRCVPLDTPTTHPLDGSTWGPGAVNPQKLTLPIDPGYQGTVYAYLMCAEKSATPRTAYLDAELEAA